MARLAPDRIAPSAWLTAALAGMALAFAGGCRAVSTGRNVDGVRYVQQGQYPSALQRFDAAMTVDSRNPDAYYNKAAVFHRIGTQERNQSRLAEAESLYKQALDMNPDHIDAHRGLAVLLSETGRVNDSFTLLKTWAVTSPQNPDARVELARLYEEYGDPRSAELYLNEALAISSGNWRAHAALGRLREQAGDYAQAIQNYERAYSLNRFQPQLPQRIADLRGKAGPISSASSSPGSGSLPGGQNATKPNPFMRY